MAANEKDVIIPPSALEKILESIRQGNCCLVVGPRFRGKSKVVRKAAEALAKTGFYRIAYMNMRDITQTDSQEFYRVFHDSIHSQIIGGSGNDYFDVSSASDFGNAMLELMANMEDNLLLQIDDLEFAPPNLISLLLGSLRSVFTTVANQPGPRFQAIVSGTVNLHQLALKDVSRFESISDVVFVDDMTLEEAREFAVSLFTRNGIQVPDKALSAFLEQTNSDPVLIKLLAEACIEQIKMLNETALYTDLLPEAVDWVLNRKPNFEVAEALSRIEGDPELLSCYLKIAQKGEMQVNKLPLKTADRPNSLDLCGVFNRRGPGYHIKAPLWRSILENHFTSAHCGRLYAIAGYWVGAIDYYQKAIHKDKIDKKSDLFGVTINGMQASENDLVAVDILARGLHACYPNCEIVIYLRTESILRLSHFFPGTEPSDDRLRQEIPLEDYGSPEVEALEGPDYSKIANKSKTRFLIPLRTHSGAYSIGLVSYCGVLSRLDQYEQHEEILQMISFLHQAARAIDGRRKYSNALQDAKSHTQTLENLDHILTTVLNHLDLDENVIFRLLLAGLTANECLGFNRAALFLVDEPNGELVGTMGVGHLAWEEADADWKNFPYHSLHDLLAALMVANYQYTPLHSAVQSIRFAITEGDLFGRVHHEGVARLRGQLAPGWMDEIPDSFRDTIGPAEEFAVAPLTAGTRRLGLVYVDNKFTHKPIDGFQMASLTSFLTQVSVVIANARLFETEKQTREYLDLLIGSSQDGIIAVDNHGWVIRYSEGAQKILGYSLEEVKQKRVDKLYGSLDVARDINTMLRASDKVRDYETTILDKDNTPVPILLSASLLRDKAGKPIGSVGFFKDQRPLKKVEDNLRLILDTVSIMSRMDYSEDGLSALAARIVIAQPVTFCSILLLDESKQNLVVKVAYPNPRTLSTGVKWRPSTGERIPFAQTGLMTQLVNLPMSQAFQRGHRIEEVDIIEHLQQYVLLDEEIQSILIVPLKAGSEVIGICILGETRAWARSPFDKEKIELISSMVTQGTVFVDRLQAHEATKNKLIMVERLRSIGEDLVTVTSGSAKSILNKVVRAACEVMGASSSVIYPWDKQKRTYDRDRIVHYGLRKRKSFSEKIRDEEGSMTGIVRRKGMVIVDDIQQGHDRSGKTEIRVRPGGFLETEGVQAFVGVSLRMRKDALGILFVNFLEPHYFSKSELEAVNLFANQAVIAIENAQLYEDLALRLEESTTLQKVGISFTDTRDLNLVLDRVLQAAFELIHADEANILFYDENKDEFRVDALMSGGFGLPLQPYQTRTRQRHGYTYEIIKSKQHISISDTTLDPRINPVTLQKGRRAAFGVPLIGRESPVGVLWMHWKTPHQISERDKRLVTAITGQAAIAIENANLFDQLKAENTRQNEVSRVLQEVGISLTETIELNDVLYRVFQAALRLVDADEGSILFYDEIRDEFQTEALMCAGIGRPLQTYTTRVRQRAGLAYDIIQGRKPISIPDTRLDPRISKVALDKGRRSTVGVPLLDHEGPVGVLWVNWKEPRQVSSREGSLLTTLASQATVAIKGAKRYAEIKRVNDELRRKSANLQAVYEAGKVISAASVGLEQQKILDRILEQAIECVTGTIGSKASVGTIQLMEEKKHALVFRSVYPRGFSSSLTVELGHTIPLDKSQAKNGKIGVTGRAALMKEAQLVPDVSLDADYLPYNADTKSELAIPFVDDDKVIGMLDVESELLNAFDEDDKVSLTRLADLAVVALRNAERAEELARSNTVALMGAWGAEIAHDVNREVGYILRETFMLQQRFDLASDVKDRVNAIEQSALQLAMPRKEADSESWLPSNISCNLDHTIRNAVNRYQNSHPTITWHFEPTPFDIQVAIHERRLFSILRHLFRNAAYALTQGEFKRTVEIRSFVSGQMAMIEVEDTGPGVRPEIIPNLFRETIPHTDGRKGSGLLLIRFISEQYGGRVELAEQHKGKGARFRVWLPVVTEVMS